jgi:hypothetical protein
VSGVGRSAGVHARERPETGAPGTSRRAWSTAAVSGPMTASCPIDGTPVPADPRHPRRICRECASRAVDADGRALRLCNVSLPGGFAAVHVDDGSPCEQATADGRVLVDGVPCRAGEARFGGVAVQVDDEPRTTVPGNEPTRARAGRALRVALEQEATSGIVAGSAEARSPPRCTPPSAPRGVPHGGSSHCRASRNWPQPSATLPLSALHTHRQPRTIGTVTAPRPENRLPAVPSCAPPG